MSVTLFVVLVVFVVCGFVGYALAEPQGKAGAGFALGFFFGPIGLVVAALLQPTPEIRAQRDRGLAQAVAIAVGAIWNSPASTSPPNTRPAGSRTVLQPVQAPSDIADPERQLAYLEEALRRQGSDSDHSDSQVLRALADEVSMIAREEAIKEQLMVLEGRRKSAEARAELGRIAKQEPLSRTDAVRLLRFQIGFTVSATDLDVTSVTGGSPAESAGLAVGDVVTSAWGVAVSNFTDLAACARAAVETPGTPLDLTVMRSGRLLTLETVALAPTSA